MTCTIGYVDNGVVIIASDSAAISGTFVTLRKGPSKVWTTNNGLIAGYAGDFSLCQWIRYVFEWPNLPTSFTVDEVHGYLVKTIGLIDKGLRKRYPQITEEFLSDWQIMIGVAATTAREATLFVLYSNGDVEQSAELYAAIGSGSYVALGSLYATKFNPMTAWEHIETALDASAANDSCIKKPWHVVYA